MKSIKQFLFHSHLQDFFTVILNHFITINASLGNMPSNFMAIEQTIIQLFLNTEEA
jgi:hypothetical protein